MSHDTLLHRLIRPAARSAPRWLRPTHLTTLRITTGVGAAACFADAALRLGAGLFVISALLDRADGELARQSGRFSRLGHRLDLASDCCCDALVFLGLAAGAWRGALGGLALLLGLLAGLGTILLFWLLNRSDHRAASPPGRRAFDPDDLILGVPVIVCTAGPNTALLLAGTLTPLAVLGVALARHLPQRRPASRRPAFDPVGGSDRAMPRG